MAVPKRQGGLFDALEAEETPWAAADAEDRLYAQVAFNLPVETLFSYVVPDGLRGRIEPGQRVLAPLGRGERAMAGYCVGLSAEGPSRRAKSLVRLLDDEPLVGDSMLELTRWIAEYYLCSWGQVLEAVLPAGVKRGAGTRMVTLLRSAAALPADLDVLKLPPKQRAALEVLRSSERALTAHDVARLARCGPGPIAALRTRGLVAAERGRTRLGGEGSGVRGRGTDGARQLPISPFSRVSEPPEPAEQLVLNADQERALGAVLATLESARHRTMLLHGVTGSGKTEVYIQAIKRVVSFGRQAIVLVPEISLTPQTIRRFRSHFPRVAVMHSHLSDVERHEHWHRIASGEVDVVVGARSAVFAPTPHLGLIVMDEEHEPSFKQETTPRYHAREVARRRAEQEGVPLVLGSATPALESWEAARRGEYDLLSLPKRVLGRPLPPVRIVDLRTESRRGAVPHALSRALEDAMRRALAEGGQVILLLNLRGFSTLITCPRCGTVARCPDCEISLTHHRQRGVAMCHYCDFEAPPPDRCPQCGSAGMNYRGIGTQRLEAEVRAKFPAYACVRMDSDAMQAPGSHDKALAAFRKGEVRILLGTQMIAKGLDFPNVTLVGVVNADTAIHLPDFRAAERTFQLVAQVAGRTGRGERGGRVIVQTCCPDHPAIALAARHDYVEFAKRTAVERRQFGYPPFQHLVRVMVRSQQAKLAQAFGEELRGALEREAGDAEARRGGDAGGGEVRHAGGSDAEGARVATRGLSGREERAEGMIRILGPHPAPISRLRGHYRYHVLLKGAEAAPLQDLWRRVSRELRTPPDVEWAVDVDPINVL